MIKQDFLLRQLQQACEALLRAAVAAEDLDLDQAEQDLGELYKVLLKMPRTLFVSLTAESLVPMLGPPEVVRVLARASLLEGDIASQRGKQRIASASYRRARELFAAVGPGEAPEDVEASEAARSKV